MARTQGERLDELSRTLTTLSDRVASLQLYVDDLRETVRRFDIEAVRLHGVRLEERVGHSDKAAEKTDTAIARLVAVDAQLTETVAAMDKRLALVEHQLAELKKSQEEASRKRWQFAGPVTAAIVSAVLSTVISLLVSRRY